MPNKNSLQCFDKTAATAVSTLRAEQLGALAFCSRTCRLFIDKGSWQAGQGIHWTFKTHILLKVGVRVEIWVIQSDLSPWSFKVDIYWRMTYDFRLIKIGSGFTWFYKTTKCQLKNWCASCPSTFSKLITNLLCRPQLVMEFHMDLRLDQL